jgi:preprotein translocase subunit SecF
MPSRMAQWGNDLYTGRRSYDIVGTRRRWFAVAATLVVLCATFLLVRGINTGIAFRGGSEFTVSDASTTDQQLAVDAVASIAGAEPPRVSVVGSKSIRVQTSKLDDNQTRALAQSLGIAYGVDPATNVASSYIGPQWGQDVTSKALRGLVTFLILVALVLTVYFRDWRMAASGIVALMHDVILTVGVYAAVGWEVTPATVIGFLTILGYSLYDTVVVFDKVRENVDGVLKQKRYTYGEVANLALNQTLVRSINTSVVAVLPVAAILFIGAFLLGAGTLRDIALALFVGIMVGTFSSVFIATPLLSWLKDQAPTVVEHNASVAAARAATVEGEEVKVRVAALMPGGHLGIKAQPKRRRPSRPAGRTQ